MEKLNCWEYKKCGREECGSKVPQLSVCPVATVKSADGINSGKNGGRVCWAVAGQFCGEEFQGFQGGYDKKLFYCKKCDFYNLVVKEEGKDFAVLKSFL